MANFPLTFFVVASLALSVFGATIHTDDAAKVSDVPCLACELLGGAVELEIAKGKSQHAIVKDIEALCGKLPLPLQIPCRLLIQHDMTVFVAAVAECNGNVKLACQSVGKCKSTDFDAQQTLTNELMAKNPLECLNCKLLAAFINNLIQHGKTTDEIENDALNFCQKLLPPLRDSCTSIVSNQLSALLQDIQNANGDAGKACVAFGKCQTETATTTSVGGDSPFECAVCKVEGHLLEAAIKSGKDKTAIDSAMLNICMKLPSALSAMCTEKITSDIDPLLDQFTANGVDVQKACFGVNRCHDEAMSANAKELPLKCLTCKVVATIAETALKQGQTMQQIDATLKQFCTHLAQPFKGQCQDQINTLKSLLNALNMNNGDALKACQAVNKCPTQIAQRRCRADCRGTKDSCKCSEPNSSDHNTNSSQRNPDSNSLFRL